MSSYQINTDISDSPHESFRPSICPPLTARVISALKQPLPWTVWTAVTGEEVRTGAWKTLPARPGSLMSFSPSYDNHRMRSGFIIFFLVAAISSIRFLRALSGPAKVRRHMYRCTCKKKKKKTSPARMSQCSPTPGFGTAQHRAPLKVIQNRTRVWASLPALLHTCTNNEVPHERRTEI